MPQPLPRRDSLPEKEKKAKKAYSKEYWKKQKKARKRYAKAVPGAT